MRVVVTGAAGFIGSRVCAALARRGDEVVPFEQGDPIESLPALVRGTDAVLHLAGVNRPNDPAEFQQGNVDLTTRVTDAMSSSAPGAVLVLSSSTQATLENAYGRSKLAAERAVEAFAGRGGRAVIFRLPNVFGPGARPNYNSAVATFAHNASRGVPIDVHEASRPLTLVYVHDVVDALLAAIDAPPPPRTSERREVPTVHHTTVGTVADTLVGFARDRTTAGLPAVTSELERELYATYLSYLSTSDLGYDLTVHRDARGGLAEFLKGPGAGQIFISRTVPGVTRGNHYHFTKTEKFFVVEGDAVIRFRPAAGGPVTEHRVRGTDYRVVDIPPDHAHSIENVGSSELVVLFWASEPFDPARPDTIPLHVLSS